ncbi:DUF4382 domain-containing protein [Ideonella sp. BN130291]|uniref:DUF4382 domain-containing protein n=1 Tax=Ideonella sp. BN130291 TaxID=3112940 RepID=UPI002E2536DB|nr:DUF4382 domain-containing protein [Ideonella sp. BN130291]
MKTHPRAVTALALAAALLAGCGGGGIGGTGSPASGTMRVSVTDAPACGYDAVNISVQKVRVHTSTAAADTDSGWSEVALSTPARIDLLTLTNGALRELGQTELPAGRYTQVRLVLAENSAGTPLANSVVPTGGTEVPLTTPSGSQSGIKVNMDLEVPEGKVADLVLDFDACKSVVKRGNSGQYNLKPVVTAVPVVSDAGLRVVGYVNPAVATPSSTHVSVQVNGVPVKSTVPDPTGKFTLYPVPAGTYDLVVAASGRVTAVMTGVPVSAAAPTNVNSATLAIAPPAATLRTVTGSVTPATANLAARQVLTGGTPVQSAWAGVDASSGAFSFTLPIEPPVKAAYVANPVSLAFTADTPVGGKYTLVAESAGVTKTQAIDVSGAVAPVSFSFP